MKIVIDIPEEVYKKAKETHDAMCDSVWLGIKYGIPLPKGHGDLIDRNKIEYLKAIYDMRWSRITPSECAQKIKYSAPTIIEADGGDAE